ncbi:sensor histidine kinase, partial [Corallococcus exiguus]|uniref:sensor histidine kinase n=1 Tax=Corallococcus exiguus TaxID=83462 RepID=UPI003D2E2CBC
EEKRIFQPFYRKDRGGEAREAGSLGLGLALVQRIAKAHGGETSMTTPGCSSCSRSTSGRTASPSATRPTVAAGWRRWRPTPTTPCSWT